MTRTAMTGVVMTSVNVQKDGGKRRYILSFCIPTYNRSHCIADALESIISQVTDDCEVVVSDNGSTDETEGVVAAFARRFDRLRYVRHSENRGYDRNVEAAVVASSGRYCWLFSDDDLLKPGAVACVLSILRQEPSLVLTNFEMRDLALSMFFTRKWLCFDSDRVYGGHELDRLLVDLSHAVTYLSNIVIDREIWMSRDREIYYDSLYIHTGVMFQKPFPSVVIVVAQPLVVNRRGNAVSVAATGTEMALVHLPNIFKKTAISRLGRNHSDIATPWRHPLFLLFLRACGIFSVNDYRSYIHPRVDSFFERTVPALIARLPCRLVNSLLILVYSVRRGPEQWLFFVKHSRDHLPK